MRHYLQPSLPSIGQKDRAANRLVARTKLSTLSTSPCTYSTTSTLLGLYPEPFLGTLYPTICCLRVPYSTDRSTTVKQGLQKMGRG